MDASEGMTKEELEASARYLAGERELEELTTDEIHKLMTLGQYLTDRGLAAIEQRGELEWHEGAPVLPYMSMHTIETVLTR